MNGQLNNYVEKLVACLSSSLHPITYFFSAHTGAACLLDFKNDLAFIFNDQNSQTFFNSSIIYSFYKHITNDNFVLGTILAFRSIVKKMVPQLKKLTFLSCVLVLIPKATHPYGIKFIQ